VVEVDTLAGNSVAAIFVASGQGVGLFPKAFFVDLESFEDGLLHVAGNERLVEIPDKCDSVLGEQSLCHIR